MVRTIGRKLLWLYALLMLIAAIGYARYDFYVMDGDGTAFMDIAGDLLNGHPGLAVNGYWNPGYPAVLAVAEKFTHPVLWRELIVARYTNVAIFVFAIGACLFFTTGLAHARSRDQAEPLSAAVSDGALHLLGLALLVLSLGRELPVAAPRSDTLLLTFLLVSMGLLLRLYTGAGLWAYPLLGLALGCAYLTKSFAFLPSTALVLALMIYGLTRKGNHRFKVVGGVAVLAMVFAAVAGPYILAISRQLGHLTTGDSARLNYAFFIDNTSRWHEWYHHDLGHASGTFTHPELLLAAPPPVFSFAAHPYGTFPLWFDPAWWTAGLKPHIWLLGHVARLLRNIAVFLRFLLGRPEPLVLLAVMLAFGAALSLPRSRKGLQAILWAIAPIGWGLLMLGIYFPIDLQDRYLTGPFLLVVLTVFAALQLRPEPGGTTPATRLLPRPATITATALIVLFAGTVLSQSATYIAERRRHIPQAHQSHPGFDPEIFPAAAALDQLGLKAGDKIACMGSRACYTDHYWARLAGAQILAEVETPIEAAPQLVWDSIPDKSTVTAPLRSMGLKFIVTAFPNSGPKPAGWIQLGPTDFFAYPLQVPLRAGSAALATFQPAP